MNNLRFAAKCIELVNSAPKLGLAVSGGVDSMAMAYLVREALGDRHLTSFTIDHGVRDGSAKEAAHVQAELQRLGIDQTRVIRIDKQQWKRFELEARNKRAKLLHTACQTHEISHLMLAHNRNDQLETFIMRLLMGSGEMGLAGIRAKNRSPILSTPDEHLVESVRPVLDYTKSQLTQVCIDNKVSWVEDHTNNDPQFTQRNAIRQLLKQGELLPMGEEKMYEYIDHLGQQRDFLESKANASLRAMAENGCIKFDAQLGVVRFSRTVFEALDHTVKPLVLLKLVEPIIPCYNHYYKLADFQKIKYKGVVTVANLRFDFSKDEWEVCRQRPYSGSKDQQIELYIEANEDWSQWQLFDNRIWISARSATPKKLVVRYAPDPAHAQSLLKLNKQVPFRHFQVQPMVYSETELLGCPALGFESPGIDIKYHYKQPELI